MGRLGTIDQLGYVVDDIAGAMAHWLEVLGVGPFFYLPRPAIQDLRYRGEPTHARIAVAISYAGSTQIELIEPLDEDPSPYRDFRSTHGTRLHHVARFVEDYDAAVAEWMAGGRRPYFEGRGLTEHQRFCYFDTEGHGGTVCELIEVAEFWAFFGHAREQSDKWDGANPIRTVGG